MQLQEVQYEHIRSSRLEPTSVQHSDTVRVGVIGYGYWGPNIVRNVSSLDNCQLVAVCDQNPAALKRAADCIQACS
jgi:predicted homoserine dehydrogenase-like protein